MNKNHLLCEQQLPTPHSVALNNALGKRYFRIIEFTMGTLTSEIQFALTLYLVSVVLTSFPYKTVKQYGFNASWNGDY